MQKPAIAALFAPSLALLFVLAIFVSNHAGAQTPAGLMFTNHHCTEGTLLNSHESGYVSFVTGAGGLQGTLSATETAGASYFKKFHVTQGAVTLTTEGAKQVALGTEPGFQALHGYAGLSQTIDFYYATFTGSGYTAEMMAFTPESTEYLFTNGDRQYLAVFTMVDSDVDVSFTPVVTLVASR